ncbi:fibrinogen C domain-containing protein 1-A-like [Lingula anatina]|uniref:Fibrinogen C domain-containing protein 1-A-like n=1 Tax=Lingula anatina TaxID=7574 RepID=A0A2R2MIM9_LINAN|nr:fibrinogen C domain-containing protein 1-A-like [Lingula anatina]|eukprot:XP_023929912.1 fibrinogen C domain-containing protein 1-A-like [Lingula anatina]
MTTDLQEKFANFTAEKPGASVRDCADLYKDGETLNGVYTITPDDSRSPFNVYCDMTTDGGGWTVFQKREDGSVDFYRPWDDYKQGFGEMGGEHWLGLENIFTITWLKRFRLRVEREDADGAWRRKEQIHTITNQSRYELRVDMKDANGVWRYARYDNFAIASEKDNYKLTVGAYSGNAGNSLGPLNGQPFSTKDRDNDASPGNCAQKLKGAWWYKSCHASNLNGLYHLGDRSSSADGVNWGAFRGHKHSLKTTEMKLRPVGFKSSPVSSG